MDLRDIERESIRAFVQSAADDGYLSGRVLDYGCGKQPYRDIVEEHGKYLGVDKKDLPGNVSGKNVGDYPWPHPWQYDAILCTQVVQYVPHVLNLLFNFQARCQFLVLTYPTNWPEVEPEDLHRFTKAGMERLLKEAGFEIVRHARRGTIEARYAIRAATGASTLDSRDEFALGYGVIGRA